MPDELFYPMLLMVGSLLTGFTLGFLFGAEVSAK